MSKINITFLLFFASISCCFSQEFTHKYILPKAPKEAWYRITLSSDLRSNAKPDVSDLQVFDSADSTSAIPYSLHTLRDNLSKKNEPYFKPLNWEKNHKPFSPQYIIFTSKPYFSSIVFKVSNHQDNRTYSLQGSDDGKKWFSIIDKSTFYAEPSAAASFYWKVISFPTIAYKQVKFSFLDSLESELQILDIGEVVQTKSKSEGSVLINQIQYEQVELKAEKTTLIKVFSTKPHWLHDISLRIKEPLFYDRLARIYVKEFRVQKRRKIREEIVVLQEGFLKTGTANSFEFIHYLKDTLFIEIENQDNSPLKIEDILFFQEPIFLTCYLKSGQQAVIYVGNKLLSKPTYDIASFAQESLKKEDLNQLEILYTEELKATVLNTTESIPYWRKKGFMWACIAISTIVLALFTCKLLAERESK
ncbi:MAG: hypothetical protein CFE21_01975 [Bacteroidetes bacterium B1(2017)]|nr:MAG: hypothetical protein CFE21_01975 [Bacteroidetes bacterium B1(2017)]